MNRAYLKSLEIEKFGCVKSARLDLSPLHALVGPNDSGKSTLLHAVELVGSLKEAVQDSTRFAVLDPLMNHGSSFRCVSSAGDAPWRFRGSRPSSFVVEVADQTFSPGIATALHSSLQARSPGLAQAINGCRLLRLDPDELRESSELLSEKDPLDFLSPRGRGLPAVYDAVQSRDNDRFVELQKEVVSLFKAVKGFRLRNVTSRQKAFGVTLSDGLEVGAEQMSEGLLYFLAFAILPHLRPNALLLVEEPENGLHPARIADVVRVLRKISETTQVVMATHSPLVVNELGSDEVSIVTRTPEEGTKVKLMRDTPDFERHSKVYALGELWLSYANGSDEAALLTAAERQ